MPQLNKHLASGLALVATCSMAHADLVVHELGAKASQTVNQLGTNLVTASVVIAIAIVISAALSKKK